MDRQSEGIVPSGTSMGKQGGGMWRVGYLPPAFVPARPGINARFQEEAVTKLVNLVHVLRAEVDCNVLFALDAGAARRGLWGLRGLCLWCFLAVL